ncbi:MAG: hypothetical protein WC028_22700 [Candidatus Obscuribacterales bacterium]|jgi:hypothetical protein
MADVADSILNKKPDATAADPLKIDFGNLIEKPASTAKPATDASATAPKTATGDSTGSAKPPVDAVPVKEAAPAKDAAAAPVDKAAPAKDAAAVPVDKAAPAKDAAPVATDKPAAALDLTKPLSPELVKGLTLSKEVARILDNDVPAANRAHKIPDAEAAYNKAIEIAKQVTPEQIAAAKADYEAVLKAKLTEKDPEKLRALAERQAADYTLMRVNDCAQGNKALWLYRQGRIEEGTTQFLQAAGLSPEDAKNLSKLTPEQKAQLGDKLNANATILTDPNFMRQYTRIMESGQKLPQEFVQIHQYLRDQQEKAAAAKTTDAPANLRAEANTQAGAETQESRIATIQRLIPNEAANIAAIRAGSELSKQLTDSSAKALTPEQQKVLADSVKAADDHLLLSKAKYEFSAAELAKLVPAEKAPAFTAAVGKIDTEFVNMVNKSPKGADGKPALSQADAGLLQTITNLDVSAADRTAALAKLGQTHPEFGKAVSDAVAAVGTPENGLNAIALQFGMTGLAKNYEEAIYAKPTAHYNYAALLNSVGGKAADGSDNKATAKAVLESSFAGLPDEITKALVADPVVSKLATDTGAKLPVVAASAEAAVDPAKKTDAAAVPGQTTDAAAKPAAPGDMAAQLAAATPDQLLDAAHKMAKEGPDYIPQTKALYEELLKRIDDPTRVAEIKKQLADKVGAIEKGQTLDGKPLDAATRLQYHAENAGLIDSLSLGITVRQEYAAYLGGKDALAIDTKSPEKLQPVLGTGPNQMDLNKSMDDQLKLVYAAADNMPVDLMKREKANLEKSMSTIGSSDTQQLIPKALDFLQGTKDRAGAIDIAVTTRTASAMMYISQGAVFNQEKKAWEHRSSPQIDSLYQPTKAVELLKQADAKYKEIHGANATDPSLDQVKAFGAQLAPEQFKAVTTAANTKMWSTGVDIVDTGLSFATQLGVAALLSKTKMGFAAKHAVADVSSFGVNFATRSVAMRLGTGQWEAPTETAVHAGAVSALVMTMKYGGIAGNKILNRNLAGYESVAMAARSMDNEAGRVMTLGEYGERLAAKGLKTEADAIRNSSIAGRKIADLTDDELRAVLPTSLSTRGAEAMTLVQGGMTPELKAINELQRNGISTVGDIKSAVAKDLTATQDLVQAAKMIPGYEKMTPRQAMEHLGAAGVPRFDTAKKIADELATLDNGMRVSRLGSVESVKVLPKMGPISGKSISVPTRDAKTMGEIESYVAKATPESEMARMFPGLKGQADDVALRQIEANGAGIFGDISRKGANGQGWRKLDEMAPEVSDITKKSKGQWLKEVFVTDRFYGGLSIPKTVRADLADVQALKGGMTRRADAVAVGSYMVGLHAYESITGVYDRMGKGVDSDGKPVKYNFSEAMLDANFGSTNPTAMDVVRRSGVLEGLFAGAAFRGFSKLGMAESRDLGVKAILGQNLNRKALTYQALSSPLIAPFAGAAQDSWTLRPMVTGADQELKDYDYGLGTAIPPADATPKAAADTTVKAPVDTTAKAPVDTTPKAPVDTTAKAQADTRKPATAADQVTSPDASP